MVENAKPTKPNVTIIRGEDGSTTVYDNETREIVVEADKGNKSSGGFTNRGQTSSGQTIAIDQKGLVTEENKNKQPNYLGRPIGATIRQNGYVYSVNQQGGFETVSRPISQEVRLQRTIELNKKINRGERIRAQELALGEKEIPLLEKNREGQIVINQRVEAQSVGATQQAFMREQVRKQIEQQRAAPPTMFGFEPVSQNEDKSFVYSSLTTRENFNLRQFDIGTNIRSGRLIAQTQPRRNFDILRNKSDRDFALRFTAYAGKTTADKYVVNPTVAYFKDLDTQTYDYQRTVELGPKGNVTVTRFATNSNRPDVVAYASVKSWFSEYGPVQKRVVQEDKIVGKAIQGALFTSDLAFAGGEVVTRKIPYVNQFYGATVETARPFVRGAIQDPVQTYGLVRGPAILGSRAYKILDYADVTQSVVGQGVQGYIQGGVPGALSRAAGGYAGERVSDKSAFFAQGGPSIPTYNLNYNRGQSNIFVVRPQGGQSEFTVLQQYKPRFVYGQEFVTDSQVGNIKQRFKITKRNEGMLTDGLFYPTTDAPPPIKVVYDRRLMSGGIVSQRSIAEVRRSLKDTSNVRGFGKRAQMSFSQAMGGGSSSNYQGTQETNYQDTLQQPIQTRSQEMFNNPTRTQAQQENIIQNYQRANQRTLRLTQLNANVRTRSITGFGSLFTSRSQSRNQSFAPSMTQFLGLTQTQTQSQTLSQTMTQTFVPSLTMTNTMTQLLSPTLTQTQTMTQTLTRTPTVTETPTITPTLDFNKAMFGSMRQQRFTKQRRGRYTQSFASLFLAKPKGFSRSSKLARSGIGVRF